MMIHLEGINKTYFNGAPLHVLKGIDLDIEKGEMVSIMGASGSGKSTLLNILGILDTYDTGTYTLNGQLIRNLSETRAAELRNRMIGFFFQSFNTRTNTKKFTLAVLCSILIKTRIAHTRLDRRNIIA